MNRIALLLILAAVVLGLSVWHHTAHAVDQNTILRELSQTKGLGSDAYTAICRSQDMLAAMDKLQSGYVQRVLSDLKRDLAKKLIEFAARFARCIATGGFVSSPGGGFTGASPCATDVGGAMSTEIKNQYLTKLKSDFMANCTARVALNAALDIGQKVLAENGRDGGAAFVRDFRDMRAGARFRGVQVARNQMANTDYCPWLRGPMAGYFDFDPGRGGALVGEQEDGLGSYTKTAGCSLPNGFDPLAPESQTTEAIAALTLPTNSIWGSYQLAQANMHTQMAAEEQADEDQYVPSGGIGGLAETDPKTGTSCVQFDVDQNTCIRYGLLKQAPAGVKADVEAARSAQYGWLINSREGNSMIQDVRSRMFSSLMDATSKAIDTGFGVDLGAQDVIDNPDQPVEPPPGYTPGGSGPGGPGTPPAACPVPLPPGDCVCMYNDAEAQLIAQGVVAQATLSAMRNAEPPNGTAVADGRVIAGQEGTFLQMVCDAFAAGGGDNSSCQPSAVAGDQIVFSGFSIDIIGPDNSVSVPGRVVNWCR